MSIDRPPAPWAGWIRSDGSWQKVAEGDSISEVWDRLIEISAGPHADKLVLKTGESPTGKRPMQRRLF